MAGPAAQAVIDVDLEGEEAAADLKQLSASIQDFADTAKSSLYAVGGFIALDKLKDAGVGMLAVFGEAESANTKLTTTLKATGNATGFTVTQLDAMASAATDMAGVSNEAMKEVQNTFARTKVISGDVFAGAQQTALDFAAAMKIDLAGAAEELSEVMVDPANELEKFRRFGITFTQTEKDMLAQMTATGDGAKAQMYVLDRLNKVVGGQAAAAANTWAGQNEKLTHKLDDLYAIGGELISGVLEPMYPVLFNLIDTFIAWTPILEEVGEGLVLGATSLMGWLEPLAITSDEILGWAALVQSIFENWKDYIAMALLAAGANVVGFATDIGYYFTEVIPGYAQSLWIIMKDIFFQLDDLIGAVVTNIGKNIADFWAALESVMSGGDFDFKPTAILEGFELKLSELPEIADKQMSEVEAIMRQSAADLAVDLAKDVEVKTQIKVEKQQADEAEKVEKSPGLKEGLNLTSDEAGSGGPSTEGLLDLSKRISDAAASAKTVAAIDAVAEQQAITNGLLNDANAKPEPPVNVNVNQSEVVRAIDRSAEVIVQATKSIKLAKSDGTFG